MIRGDRAMRHLSVCKLGRELIAGFAQRQEKSSLTPFSSPFSSFVVSEVRLIILQNPCALIMPTMPTPTQKTFRSV